MNPALLLLLIFDGDGDGEATGQSGPLVGSWENVAWLKTSSPDTALETAHERTNLEATDANHY